MFYWIVPSSTYKKAVFIKLTRRKGKESREKARKNEYSAINL